MMATTDIENIEIDEADAVRRPYDIDDYQDVVGLLARTETQEIGDISQEWGYVISRADNEPQVFVTRTDRLEYLDSAKARMVREVVQDVLPDQEGEA